MKKIALVLMVVFLLAGGIVAIVPSPSHAQDYGGYAPPPPNAYAQPWVGPGTPWVYYNGDWFLNGVLYYFFGSLYGWAPYYAYPSFYIVRPGDWYGPRWWAWYHGHPHYWHFFMHHYPYWRSHREGFRYGRGFYERYNRGQGRGWHGGFNRSWGHNWHHPGGHGQAWHHPGGHGHNGWGQHFQPQHGQMGRGRHSGPQHRQMGKFQGHGMQQRAQMRHGGQGFQHGHQNHGKHR